MSEKKLSPMNDAMKLQYADGPVQAEKVRYQNRQLVVYITVYVNWDQRQLRLPSQKEYQSRWRTQKSKFQHIYEKTKNVLVLVLRRFTVCKMSQ